MATQSSKSNRSMRSSVGSARSKSSLQQNSILSYGTTSTQATQPKGSPRSTKSISSAVKPGRKVVSGPSAHLMAAKDAGSKAKTKTTENATIEELDQILEDDALVLINMKKEISASQEEELVKLRESVLAVKKEYDSLHVENNLRDVQLKSLQDKEASLLGVDKASISTVEMVQQTVESLKAQTQQVLDEYAAEQRTIKMQTLMIKRLEGEINKCRIDTSKSVVTVDHAKHDLSVSEVNLHNHRQELIEQEHQLEKLQSTLKSRKDQRERKLNMLHNISLDGETSVARIQTSISENTRKMESTGRQRMRYAHTARSNASRHTRGSMEDDEFADLVDPQNAKKRVSVNQVKEMLSRFQTMESRMERLKLLDQELRSNIEAQQEKKREFSEHLAHTVYRIQQLASSRQIYQEVDLKDSALAMTSKECDESKDRAHRLKLSIGSLKQSIPRFLVKVTKTQHAVPTEQQLPDAVLKLEDELTKLIKTIGTALLKDATPEDLALISQLSAASGASGEATSEFSRLQRLPGYSRLQRQLFFNLMTARPDVSSLNIRINDNTTAKVKPPKATTGPAPLFEDVLDAAAEAKFQVTASKSNAKDNSNMLARDVSDPDFPTEPALDRDTIKSISKLIYDRDSVKVVDEPVKEITSLFG
mmetsp:Transcript_18727/g.31382  ORF Transcript_18727/g.31382 Transcript_18727/m.31382 type:complete len:648 (-) Transcript_18727:163-2106(-)